ncbi:hypothetical protein D0868_14533 [Hortaea werneckii]|uniref:Uncharacterized protein n=1 Tax=Hortaea werneckii TaxID=91943 RepID=A0A3M6XHK1_HORWE|nr:hypothetical protein D0868_14533 [Hortaea werneckii]
MSLASTLAGEGMRPASFLPSIKCSSCGDEIEIAQMGDHTCGKAPPSPKSHPPSLSNPFTLRQMNASGQNAPHSASRAPEDASAGADPGIKTNACAEAYAKCPAKHKPGRSQSTIPSTATPKERFANVASAQHEIDR